MKYTPDLARTIGMIAGGTGITPMLVRRDLRPSAHLHSRIAANVCLST